MVTKVTKDLPTTETQRHRERANAFSVTLCLCDENKIARELGDVALSRFGPQRFPVAPASRRLSGARSSGASTQQPMPAGCRHYL